MNTDTGENGTPVGDDDEITDQQVTALIDQLFQKLPEIYEGTQFYRVKTVHGDAIQFAVQTHTGRSYHIFELDRMARLCLQDCPPHLRSDFALMTLGAFITKLVQITSLGIENANDLSNLAVNEVISPIAAAFRRRETGDSDTSLEKKRTQLLDRVEVRNKVMLHRPFDNPLAGVSIPRLIGALAASRIARDGEEITVGMLAGHLGCSNSAVYKTISRYGITPDEFFNVEPKKWRPRRLDKLDLFLSKISDDDE
jgi:hypothetical protein